MEPLLLITSTPINQTSSEISGKLPDDYRQHIGDILAAQKGDCDEIIIIKNGLVTDTSFTNIAIYKDGKRTLLYVLSE